MDKNIIHLAATTIVQNQKKIREYWRDIDDFKKFGSTANEDVKVLKRSVQDMTIGQIITACFTLPPYISKAKKNLATMPDGPDKLKLQMEIQIKEQELSQIKALRDESHESQ